MSGTGQFAFLPPLVPNGAGTVTARLLGDVIRRDPSPKAPRQSGGAGTKVTARDVHAKLPPRSKPVDTMRSRTVEQLKAADSKGRLLRQSDVSADLTEKDLNRGFASCVERGLIPSGFDAAAVLEGDNRGGLIAVAPARLHKHVAQFKRQEILTSDLGFGTVGNFKLDIAAVEAIDPSGVRISTPPPVPAPAPASPPQQDEVSAQTDPRHREDPRTYAELLDLYSLHEFIIRKGVALRNTPEFTSYQRTFRTEWGAINQIIVMLEKLLGEFGVPLAYIDGKKVVKLASVDLGPPSRDELLACIANRADVDPHMASVVQKFKQGPSGHDIAATKIQSIVRMRLQRKRYLHLREATKAVILIQRVWAVHRGHMKTRKTLAVQRDALIAKWRQTMLQFAADWPRIVNSRRVIVHIPSLSYAAFQTQTTRYFAAQQRCQLARLADLTDDKTEIVFVSPVRFENDTLQYYFNMLQAAGVRAPESRVVVLVPESQDRLERVAQNIGLTKAVLCSSRLMRTLSAITRGKTAYIVPSVVGPDEQLLAAKLNLPLLGPEPRVAQVLSTKSGAKTVFENADTVTPVGAHNVRSVQDLFGALARLVAEYPEYPRWLVKLDTEYSSRGHAFLDVRRLRAMEEWNRLASTSARGDDAGLLAHAVLEELLESGPKWLKIVNTAAYPDWASYSRHVEVSGCTVEAVPSEILGTVSANMFIEPDGTAHLQSVQQQIASQPYVNSGAMCPQTIVPFEAVRDASMSVAAAAFRKKVMGFASIDYVVFKRPDTGAVRMWAVDLDLRLTNQAAMHSFAMLCTGATYDHATGECVVRARPSETSMNPGASATVVGQVPLAYAYSGLLHHPLLGALRHKPFMKLFQQRQLTWDNMRRCGLAFQLVDDLRCKCIGFLAIENTPAQSAKTLERALDLTCNQIATIDEEVSEADCNIHPMLTAARNLHKATSTFAKRLPNATSRSRGSEQL
jgi:hypothetical protein